MELGDWAEAAEAALEVVGDVVEPVAEEELFGQAEAETDEQAEEADAGTEPGEPVEVEDDELFGDVAEATPPPPAPQDISSMTFLLPGVETPVTLQELKDGYLSQRDATQKWQAAADMRKANEKAVRLWEAIEADPLAVARQMAIQAGLLEEGAAPVRAVEFSPIRTQQELDAEIAKRVEEAVKSHPSVQEAAKLKVDSWLGSEFAELEKLAGKPLGPKSRAAILRRATAAGTSDLRLVFQSLMAEKAQQQAAADQLRQTAPAKPSARPTKRELTEEPKSWDEAARRAALQTQTA